MPSSSDRLIKSRTDLMPSWCPAMRGSPCCSAHRPFPSMMTAKCLGRRSGSSLESRSESEVCSASLDRECVMDRSRYPFADIFR